MPIRRRPPFGASLRWAAGFLLLITCVTTPLAAQSVDIYDSGGPLTPEQAAFDVTHYLIDLTVDPAARRLAGSVTVTADLVAPTRRIALDLDTLLTVDAVSDSRGRALAWQREGGRILIDFGAELAAAEEIHVTIGYSGQPRVAPMAPWDGGFVWATTQSGAPWIATAVQGEGSDVWWPSKDHVSDKPDSLTTRIRVPEPLVVASNGRLREVEEHADGTRTFHHFVSTPISAYNVALNIAPYERIESELQSVAGEAVPVTFYALPESTEQARAFLPEVVEHLEFYEELLGPYPFRAEGYAVAQTPHLGMEHQTVIAYGADFDPGAMTGGVDWGFDALHHHELAHEWWGNLMTNADWKDMWLHEGFATYMQSLYAERLGGEERYRSHLAAERSRIANRAPVAPRETQTAGQIYTGSGVDIYSKGAWILHSLRWVVGDDAFFTALRRMAYPDPALERVRDGGQVRFAATEDFIEIAEQSAGAELDWFFELYLRQPALPRLQVQRGDETLHLAWEVPPGLSFPMPVELEIDGERHRVELPGGRASVPVPRGARVIVDPAMRILREPQQPLEIGPR